MKNHKTACPQQHVHHKPNMATTSDRWLWLTLGLTAIIAAKYIRHAITDTVDLTAIDRPKAPITKPKSGTPEDCTYTLPNPLSNSST